MSHKIYLVGNDACLKLGKKGESQTRLIGKKSGEKSCYGHSIESQAGRIDTLLQHGRFTIAEMAVYCYTTPARIRQHLFACLRDKKGHEILTDSGERVFNNSCSVSRENNALTNRNLQLKADEIELAKVKHVQRVKALNKINEKLKQKKA